MNASENFLQILDLLGVKRSSLPAAASDDTIAAFERHVGVRLPEALATLYRMHDGEFSTAEQLDSPRIFFDYPFLPLRDAQAIYDTWAEIRASFEQHGVVEDFPPTSRPEDAIQCVYSHKAWVPFAGRHGHLALDFAPGPQGVDGQVINFGRDDELHVRLAADFEAFLALVVERYKARQWHAAFANAGWTALYDEFRLSDWHR